MDSETFKNLASRVQQSDLDEDERQEVISLMREERKRAKAKAYLQVRPDDDGLGSSVKLVAGESREISTEEASVFVELTRVEPGDTQSSGEGGPPQSEEWTLADYHLTYGQAKRLLRLLGVDRFGTPGDVETTIRAKLGTPDEVNPLLVSIQRNGVRGWRAVDRE